VALAGFVRPPGYAKTDIQDLLPLGCAEHPPAWKKVQIVKFTLEIDVSNEDFTEGSPDGMVSGVEIGYVLGSVQKRLDRHAMRPGENGVILSDESVPIGEWRITN